MEKIFYITMLYDFYGELLTDKQKNVVELYFLNDLSLHEIGEQFDITRQAVLDMIKRTEKTLQQYEDKLHLVDRYIKEKEKISEVIDIIENTVKENRLDNIKEFDDIKNRLINILD